MITVLWNPYNMMQYPTEGIFLFIYSLFNKPVYFTISDCQNFKLIVFVTLRDQQESRLFHPELGHCVFSKIVVCTKQCFASFGAICIPIHMAEAYKWVMTYKNRRKKGPIKSITNLS